MGVGGRTIAEAKQNVNIHEFEVWLAYMEKRGMLQPTTKESSQNLSEQAKLLLKLCPNTVVKSNG